ncbi:MAG: TerC family protein [Anaerolineales bacterium]|nr:TerC family protein [Anaerolineales bacterium]MCZ2120682.1 TerC family protein [Anaerolineales bacterium]
MEESIWLWIGFNIFVLFLLALDLGVFHRNSHAISTKEALGWSIVWVSVSLLFNAGIYFFWDRFVPNSEYSNGQAAIAFFTGYIIEKSLSVDNIFIFVLIFSYFSVPPKYQHHVLFWGILGALIMRGALIMIGSALIEQFHWVIYIFGIFLIYTGFKLFKQENTKVEPEKNPLIKLFRKIMPVTDAYEGDHFFVKRAGAWMATPLFLVLLFVESTDLVFALDSIPAIFAITKDPFIIYTSNVCAILGLRALYFLLASVVDKFHYLSTGLAVILIFVGMKMLIEGFYHIPISLSLGVIFSVLTVSIVASLWRDKKLAQGK